MWHCAQIKFSDVTAAMYFPDRPTWKEPHYRLERVLFRFIQLGVFEAERRWASAMSDKMEMEDNPDKLRKRMSMRMHLKRAVYHATALEQLVRNSTRVRIVS